MDLFLYGTLTFLLAAVLAVVLPMNKVRVWTNLAAQAVGCVLVLTTTIPVLLGGQKRTGTLPWSYPVERIDIEINSLGAFFLTFSLPMTLLGSLFAVGYLSKDIRSRKHVGIHFALLTAVQLSYIIIYSVQNAFAFLVGWEIAAISAWLLVIWDHRNQKIRFAGFNYLISTHFSLLFLVAAFTIIHGATASFQFADFQAFMTVPSTRRSIVFVFLIISFGLKSAFYPFHTWLPRAHSAAPAHVSALMSGVIHKAGLFGMLKFILMIGTPELWMGWFVLTVSAVSAFMGILYTITQRDIKRLLGYSSTENVGIAGIGLGIGCLGLAAHDSTLAAIGFAGGILHILNHAIFKCLLFYGAGAIYRFTHTIDLEKLGGLLKAMKWTGPIFLIGALASAALPPFNAFISEFLLYLGLLRSVPELGIGQMVLPLFAALLALVGGLSAMSITRAFGLIFLGSPRDPGHTGSQSRENMFMTIPMIVHLIAIFIVGFAPAIALRCVQAPVGMMLGGGVPSQADWAQWIPVTWLQSITWFALCFVTVLAVTMALRFLLLPRSDRKHVTWGCGYTLPNTRMQYTGSSFAAPMVAVFQDLLRYVKREQLPEGVFPQTGSYETNCVDSVERRMFNLLNNGEKLAAFITSRLAEGTRVSFAIGLFALVALIAVVVWK